MSIRLDRTGERSPTSVGATSAPDQQGELPPRKTSRRQRQSSRMRENHNFYSKMPLCLAPRHLQAEGISSSNCADAADDRMRHVVDMIKNIKVLGSRTSICRNRRRDLEQCFFVKPAVLASHRDRRDTV